MSEERTVIDLTPIRAPGGFAPAVALGHSDADGNIILVAADAPLPVVTTRAEVPPPLEGYAATDFIAGPFEPAPFAPVYLELSGEWEGNVRLLRSVDGGVTKHALTAGGAGWARYSGNACEPIWQESERGAELYLELAITSGTIVYRVSQ